ncbi:DNA double-strand break repair nuclease NurA [Caldisericum exile]|nr:DNA double-strand break repair nuclease NurA [Caldisericum exile]
MKFNSQFLKQIRSAAENYVEQNNKKKKLLERLSEEIFNIDFSLLDLISSPPEYNYAKFEEKFSLYTFNSNFVKDYSILATDGSRITIDEGLPFPFYIINVASVFEKVGKSSSHKVNSKSEFYFNKNDLYDEKGDFLAEQDINLKMLLKEAEFLSESIEMYNPDIALFDGSLILWGLKQSKKIETKKAINLYEKPIFTAFTLKKPIAGYISGTRSKEVIKTLILYLKRKGNNDISNELLLSLNDSDLMNSIMKDNQRTSIFSSTEKLLSNYSHKIYFFFLKIGQEVVRVEIPDFVYESKEILDRLIHLLFTEIERGKGYPLILKLAHFEAVINEKDKKFIENILRSKIKESSSYSEKFLSKISRRI